VVNRAALILKYKSPAISWINEADPNKEDPGITTDDVNVERTIYLISSADGDTEQTVERWVKRNYKALFEEELDGWYTDPELWPKKRTLKLFREWFDVECHTVLIDTVDGVIINDDDI
jgi:hypothetical protein